MFITLYNISTIFPFSSERKETHAIVWPGGHFPLCPPIALILWAPSGSTWTAGRGHTGCRTAGSGKSGSSGVPSAVPDSSAAAKNQSTETTIKQVSYFLLAFNSTSGRF